MSDRNRICLVETPLPQDAQLHASDSFSRFFMSSCMRLICSLKISAFKVSQKLISFHKQVIQVNYITGKVVDVEFAYCKLEKELKGIKKLIIYFHYIYIR